MPDLERIAGDIERIAAQERALVFDKFDEAIAWALGSRLREAGEAIDAPIVIDIRSHRHLLFCCALAGATPDNWEWVRRKSNVVHRFYRASYAVGLELRARETTLQIDRGVDEQDYAAHGGSFPIRVAGAGFVGSITVSGLPQRDDHNLVVAALCAFLGRNLEELALAAPG
ncbi:MAG: heme-degrading domain-containing protein [Roseiarcus sp.]